MTIEAGITTTITQKGGQYAGYTVAWDVHHTNIEHSAASCKNSNIYKEIRKIFANDPKIRKLVVAVGRMGWSAHSPTQLHIFDVTNVKDIDCFVYEVRNAETGGIRPSFFINKKEIKMKIKICDENKNKNLTSS